MSMLDKLLRYVQAGHGLTYLYLCGTPLCLFIVDEQISQPLYACALARCFHEGTRMELPNHCGHGSFVLFLPAILSDCAWGNCGRVMRTRWVCERVSGVRVRGKRAAWSACTDGCLAFGEPYCTWAGMVPGYAGLTTFQQECRVVSGNDVSRVCKDEE